MRGTGSGSAGGPRTTGAAGASASGSEPGGPELTSPAFAQGDPIPVEFTCDGKNVSPLAWSGLPEEALALALVVEDLDAPGGTFVHWVLYGLDPARSGLDRGEVPAAVDLEDGAPAADAIVAIEGARISEGTLTATYGR